MVTNNRVSGPGNLEVENHRFATSKIDMFYRCLKIRNGKSPFGMAAIHDMYEGCNHPNHHHQVGHFTAVDMLVNPSCIQNTHVLVCIMYVQIVDLHLSCFADR